MAKTIVVLGARNLGGAIIDHFLAQGWSAAGVARSEETLARVRERPVRGRSAAVICATPTSRHFEAGR